jgi:hypothetical protein
MSNDAAAAARTAHKNRLIGEGELYRVRVALARAHVNAALRPEALLHEALGQASRLAGNRLDGLFGPTGLRWQSLMPLALTALSFIGRRRLVKPALGVGLAAVAVAWLLRRRGAADSRG